MTEQPSLIKYPCEFPIKIMGKSHKDFVRTVITIVKKYAPSFDETSVQIKTGQNNTYSSITCTINAVSQTQIDTLYQELCSHSMVTLVL